ncbi:hypothetical protein [Saccharopolyspora hattusasensis]|uniref:hypothetical protein n=1 Tax=Saccharopolyspora hattusasensis TaxID=1128679 RepID=UPI003D98D960
MVAAPVLAACSSQQAPLDPFAVIPDACDVVSAQSIQDIVGGAHGENVGTTPGRADTCRWQYRTDETPDPPAQGVAPYRQSLAVQLFLHEKPMGQDEVSGVKIAQDVFSTMRKGKSMVDKGTISGLGDEAYGAFDDRNGYIDFRAGNVTVELRYEGNGVSAGGAAGLGRDAIQSALTKAANDVAQHLRK